MRNLSENFTNEELMFIAKAIQDIQNNPAYTDVFEELKEFPVLKQRRIIGLITTAAVIDLALKMVNDPHLRSRVSVEQKHKHEEVKKEVVEVNQGEFDLPDDELNFHTDIVVAHTELTPIPQKLCNRIEITVSFSNKLSITGVVATLKPLIYYEDGSRRRPAIKSSWVLLTDVPVDDINVLKNIAKEVASRQNEKVETMIAEFLKTYKYTEIV